MLITKTNLHAASCWNYALDIDEKDLEEIDVILKPVTPEPWNINASPIELKVPARKINGWDIDKETRITREAWYESGPGKGDWAPGKKALEGEFRFTPRIPGAGILSGLLSDKVEKVTLVPYGCIKLRVTIFPDAATNAW